MLDSDILKKLTLEEKCALLSGESTFGTRALPARGIPAMLLADGPHGLRKQTGEADHLGMYASEPATCFPPAATVANSWNPALAEALGEAIGTEAAAQGVSVVLGPGLNMKRSPLCGRNFEYFSEDPYLAGKLAASYIRGVQKKGVAACPKHFAANNQELRRMASDSILDERTLREIYLTAFEIAVKEGAPKAIMSSYNRVNGTYANENAYLLQDILRREWGFSGMVVTDWGASNDHVEGVRCGSSLEMPAPGGDAIRELAGAVRSGRLPEAAVDARLKEVLTCLFDARPAVEAADGHFDQTEHHALARRAAAESAVLLKNEGGILPLAPGTTVALIGDFAETPRYQGAGSSLVNPTRLDTARQAVAESGLACVGYACGFLRRDEKNEALMAEAAALAPKAQAVLVYLGLDEASESEGLDRTTMCLAENQAALLHTVAQANPNVIVVLRAGSPVEMPWRADCRALVHGYLGGQAGAGAMLDVLTGKICPSGKLAETYPVRYADTPAYGNFPSAAPTAEYREGLYIGYRYYETRGVPVAFPFGYGLSYTTFAYSGLTAAPGGVCFMITNTGRTAGAETAQLYVAKPDAAVFRPAQELKGFCKVLLQPGEARTVTIPLDDKAFRYWNVKTGRWEIEGGAYTLHVGASSADIRLTAEISVPGTAAPNPYAGLPLAEYQTGNVQNMPKEEFEALLGHAVPAANRGRITRNSALRDIIHGRSPLGWLAWGILTRAERAGRENGRPQENIVFLYNMPLRALAKMAGGPVSMEMVDGLVMELNGWWIVGLLRTLFAFGKNLACNAALEKRLTRAENAAEEADVWPQ